MDSKELRHSELRARILDFAEESIAQGRGGNLTARSLAKEVGCAVGAIYNVFEDMYAITQGVNLRTFERMRLYVIEHILMEKVDDPRENLMIAACAYLHFALENEKLWLSVYEIEMKPVEDFPEVYVNKSHELFSIVELLVAQIYPTEEDKEVQCITRTIFSAVHGIVYLGVERRLLSVQQESLESMVKWLVRQIINASQI